ncbi:MAG: hypothetical protein WEA99_06695 [Brumimicrobium sp.]
MCSTEFKNKSLSFFTLLLMSLSVLFSCSEEEKKATKDKKSKMSFEERAKRAVEAELDINATEEYGIEIHKKHLDRDTIEDAVILVNREKWAYIRAEKQGNMKFLKKLGYVGPYNNVFVYIGKSDKFVPTPTIGSAAKHPLDIGFKSITTPSQNDFYVNYRIRNSMHRNYYTIRGDRVYLTFNCPVFDSIGEENPVIYDIKHTESSIRLAKDIGLFKAEIPNYNPQQIEDPNSYKPDSIVGTDELFVFFIFDESKMSYVTPMTREK